MSCEGYGLLISKWVDGEAPAEEARRAEAHVASCAACRRLADEFRRNANLLESALGPEPFGQQVAGHVFGSIARREALWRWGARLAAAAAVLGGVLFIRSEREKERELFRQQIQIAGNAVDRLAEALQAERARPPQVEREVVYLPPYAGPEALPSPIPRDVGPTPAVVEHAKNDPPPLPDRRLPGTVAMDRVDAYNDDQTGCVALTWTLNRDPGPAMASVKPVYFVYRREKGTTNWGSPVNETALESASYDDRSARGMTEYEYCVVSVGAGLPRISEDIAQVKTRPDLRIEFLGTGTVKEIGADGQPKSIVGYSFAVHVRRDGKWLQDSFLIQEGEWIGAVRKTGDFSTGIRFVKAGAVGRRLFADLETSEGRTALWKDVLVVGAYGRLLTDERAK